MLSYQSTFKYLTFLAGLLLVFSLIVFTGLSSGKSFVLLGFLLLAVFLFLKPVAGLFLLIILRPAVDRLGTSSFLEIGSLSLNYNSVLGIITLLWGGVVIIRNYDSLRRLPSRIWIILFGLISLLSLFLTPVLKLSFEELVRIASIFAFYATAFILVNSKAKFKKLLIVFVASSFLPLVFALKQLITNKGEVIYGEFFRRLFGTFFYPNSLAFFLVFLIAILLLLAKQQKNKSFLQLSFLTLSLLSFVALLGTYTRGAWLGSLLIFIAFSIYGFRKMAAGLVLLIAFIYLALPTFQERINDIIRLEPFSSLMWRFRLWGKMMPHFFAKPLFGHGLMSFRYLSENLQGLQAVPAPEAHNDYLRLAIEVGIIGTLNYLLIHLRLAVFHFKKYLKTKDSFLKDIAFSSLVLIIVFMIMAAGDNILRGTATQWVLFSFLGASSSLLIKK